MSRAGAGVVAQMCSAHRVTRGCGQSSRRGSIHCPTMDLSVSVCLCPTMGQLSADGPSMGQLQSYAPFVVRVAQSGPWYPGLHTHLIEEPLGLPCCPRRRERTLACRKQQRSSSPPPAAAATSGGGGGGGRRERVLDGPRYMCHVCKGCERSAQQLCF